MLKFCKIDTFFVFTALSLTLSACAPRYPMYSAGELAGLARRCGVAEAELIQDRALPAALFLLTVSPFADQLACIENWAHPRGMRVVYVDSVEGAN